ncbi:EAL domain-containing protein [Ureibacillus manganicus]|uniref:Diguanylate phosphodiesterase n=1 Tax=Ureibacillus manganicus DSM 26584 TaxID=1384049 RepID=A0A0A3I301_9BACL|nr:EAL domain-containing protein [Ureibacillus manganicus]KGR79196.1 diguanylate phosphodiesterase [Ureibacillus manganicus DSM 26584]
MECHSCLMLEIIYKVKLKGTENLSMMQNIVNHLKRRNLWVKVEDEHLEIKESGIREFLDFCEVHMETEKIFFRIDNLPWNPLRDIQQYIQAGWIDEVIRKKLITCHFQPIVDRKENIYAYELLARFQHEDGSTIYPNEIFTAAKKRGRLYALDRLCRLTAVQHSTKIDTIAFINFIPTSIYSPEFCLKSTISLANQLGINPNRFVFEVVETEQVEDLDHLKNILTYYRDKGFQYALDDVGEGFSTIDTLAHLQPRYMKLDMKYVQGVAFDPHKQQTAQSFLEKAIEIGSTPLAEGVETREDFNWLKQIGYELFQGYLFGKPAATPIGFKEVDS